MKDDINKGNNKITELRTILQRESFHKIKYILKKTWILFYVISEL